VRATARAGGGGVVVRGAESCQQLGAKIPPGTGGLQLASILCKQKLR
jgi:hypothetical protein